MTWSGSVFVEPGRLVYSGQLGAAHAHAHAAVQITVATSGQVQFYDAAGGRSEGRAGVIPAGVAHAFDAGSATGYIVYVESSGSVGRALASIFGSGDRSQAAAWTDAAAPLATPPDITGGAAVADVVLQTLLGAASTATPMSLSHPSIRQAVELVPQLLDGPVRIADVARAVNLSADRLGRLFARDLGLSFPAYVRWARLMRAIEVARSGHNITDAAHTAGFADSSHANRAFHEMFGIAPNSLKRSVSWAADTN